ncbi:MAG TPA: GxxExxY protein [Terriglobales bacterium]|nr:GxxExxY protein [Terriglobales bacterium]
MGLLRELFVGSAHSAVKIFRVSDRNFTSDIIGSAIKIHRKLGPGLLESAYEACLTYELVKLGYAVERQKPVPLIYEAAKLDCGFRADIVVARRVAVELKCKDALHPVDEAQLLSHLRLLNLSLGILINFHVVLLKNGIRRLVNNYVEPANDSDGELLTAELAESDQAR